ncbi:MAG: peroxide stress protein YaaA [Streptococcaceae bacterium]|jgi:cytoplasmic iron level regulating protein YaaA (DUF328/UPF0246 family)|nr:peroxide stress protein YaaA [Streptococcaceae bacterium]
MYIIISPAKKMNINPDDFPVQNQPIFLKEANQLMEIIQGLSIKETKELWQCNDKLNELNYQRFQKMQQTQPLTPAIMSYEGLQYQSINADLMSQEQLDYLEKHLRILSGFYGILKPFDGVVPYRLEMQAKLQVSPLIKNMYQFWDEKLFQELANEKLIINLASKEYSKAITPYLNEQTTFLTISFASFCTDKRTGIRKARAKATESKIARGQMVRFMAENQIETVERIKEFCDSGFSFNEELSTADHFTFTK